MRGERHREQTHDSVKTGNVKPEYEVICQDPDHPAGVPIFYRMRQHPDAMRRLGYMFRCPVCRDAYRRAYYQNRRGHEVVCQSPNHPADTSRRFILKTAPSLYEKNGWKMNCPLCRRAGRNSKATLAPVKAYVGDWARYQVQPYCPARELLRAPKTPKAPKPKPRPISYRVRCRDPLHNSALHPVKFKSKLSSRMYRERGYLIRCPGCRKRKERHRWKRIGPAVKTVIDPPFRKKVASPAKPKPRRITSAPAQKKEVLASWNMPESFPPPPKGISNWR